MDHDEDISDAPTLIRQRPDVWEPSDDHVDRYWQEQLYTWFGNREASLFGKHGGVP